MPIMSRLRYSSLPAPRQITNTLVDKKTGLSGRLPAGRFFKVMYVMDRGVPP
jgi:hypothetical protein